VEWLQGWVGGVALALAGHVGNRINTMTYEWSGWRAGMACVRACGLCPGLVLDKTGKV
jgi:hypothetical protein